MASSSYRTRAQPAPSTPLLEEVAFLLLPAFSLLSMSAALDALRQANRVANETLYRWHFHSVDGADVTSSSGLTIPSAGTLDDCADVDPLAVAVGFSTASHFTKSYRDHFGVTPTRDRAMAGGRGSREDQ